MKTLAQHVLERSNPWSLDAHELDELSVDDSRNFAEAAAELGMTTEDVAARLLAIIERMRHEAEWLAEMQEYFADE